MTTENPERPTGITRQSDKIVAGLEQSPTPAPERLAYTVEESAAYLGISRGSAYEAARTGQIPTIKIGRRILVPIAALQRLLAGQGAL